MDDRTAGRFLTVAEAARELKVSASTVRRWIERGRVHPRRVGERRIVLRADELYAAVVSGGTARGAGAEPMAESPRLPALSDERVERLRAAMERARAVRERIAAERGGEPLPSSVELLREQRDARSSRL